MAPANYCYVVKHHDVTDAEWVPLYSLCNSNTFGFYSESRDLLIRTDKDDPLTEKTLLRGFQESVMSPGAGRMQKRFPVGTIICWVKATGGWFGTQTTTVVLTQIE